MKKLIIFVLFLFCINFVYADWANSSYNSCKNISITNPTSSALTDFPVNLNVSYMPNMQTDFDDIRFYSAGCGNSGNLLSAEAETINASSNAYIWVKVNLSTGSNTISMYYNNSATTSNWDTTGTTWDTNYKAVWHRNGTDSTSNNNDGTAKAGVTESNGKFGTAISFPGTSSVYINVSDSDSLDLSNSATIEIVAYENTLITGEGLIDKYNTGTNQRSYRLLGITGTELQLTLSSVGTSGASNSTTSDCGLTNSIWNYIVIVYNGAGYSWTSYKNGTSCQTMGTAYNSLYKGTAPLIIGAQNGGLTNFNGSIDEIRISNTQRNVSYINATYQYLFNPTSFVSYSTEQNYTAPISSTCSTFQTTGIMNCNDNCSITSNTAMSVPYLNITGTGSVTISANITGATNLMIQGTDSTNRCYVTCINGGCFM